MRKDQRQQKVDFFSPAICHDQDHSGTCLHVLCFCLPVWYDQDHDGSCLLLCLCLQNQHPFRMKILRGLIKYARNTHNGRTRKMPSEDTLFYFRKRKRTAVSMTANDSAFSVCAHTLWLMTERSSLEMLSIVVVPVLEKSLFLRTWPFIQLTTDLHTN